MKTTSSQRSCCRRRSPPHHWLRVGGNGLVRVIGCPRSIPTTRAATRPFKLACRLLWRDGSRLKSRQHVGSRQWTFPPQEGHNRTRIGNWQRGGRTTAMSSNSTSAASIDRMMLMASSLSSLSLSSSDAKDACVDGWRWSRSSANDQKSAMRASK